MQKTTAIATVTFATVWGVGFLMFFFAQELPNNSTDPESPLTRTDVWRVIFVEATSVLNPFDYSINGQKSGWAYFDQRLPFIGIAAILMLMAGLIGRAAISVVADLQRILTSERMVLELGTGLSLLSLWILACGLAGWQNTAILCSPAIIALLFLLWKRFRPNDAIFPTGLPLAESHTLTKPWRLIGAGILLPFVLHIFLGGMTPPRDFDVREYHLQGPKEWFQTGQIQTLEHNVYTSFPFLSEMLSLGSMIIADDWWDGAIAGKLTLTAFQFLSAICVYAIGRRWGGTIPGLIAAIAFLSTPWTTRISIIAYAEGAISFYLIATLMTALMAAASQDLKQRTRLIAVTGFLAGSAMASKYPGLVSVVTPISIFFLIVCWPGKNCESEASSWISFFRSVVYFVAGISLAVGPWLAKNFVATGNPVYPLAYSVFGANDWSPQMDARWQAGHSASEHEFSRIPIHINDLAVKNDWQSGLLFALAVPALLLTARNRQAGWMWLYVIWMLFTWWALTHRIDRFWVPIVPLLAVLAGMAWNLNSGRFWRSVVAVMVVVCCTFNYGFCRLPLVGFHGALTELSALKKMPIRQDLRTLNKMLPKSANVLMVGEAEVFDAEFRLVYNTVFDESLFQQWTSGDLSLDDESQPMKTTAEISAALRDREITHVYVNWSEILRYRQTYGYTEYVTPGRFLKLQEAEILSDPRILSTIQLSDLRAEQRTEVMSWPGIRESLTEFGDWPNIAIYSVR